MQATAPFGFRYQYLAGGVNTGKGWATWNPDGTFVTAYIQESVARGIIPVFSYYQLRQSAPGGGLPDGEADARNLQDVATMTAYFTDLKDFFQKASAFPNTLVVLHVEPDLWGFMEQRAKQDDAATVPVQVAGTGLPELAQEPNTAAGFAQAIVALRDAYAPNVILAYHLSTWGTGINILDAKPTSLFAKVADKLGRKVRGTDAVEHKPTDATITALATRSAAFYQSLHAPFDLTFAEFLDRDSAFYQYVYGNPAAWYTPTDYDRHIHYLATFAGRTRQRLVLWQIPYGNTKMRRENNTWHHYQSNQVQTLLGDDSSRYLTAYLQAGVVALLFGGGGDGVTCACNSGGNNASADPLPITGNTGNSLTSDDDGGYFREQAATHYSHPLPQLPR
jgi:hypothetical protein